MLGAVQVVNGEIIMSYSVYVSIVFRIDQQLLTQLPENIYNIYGKKRGKLKSIMEKITYL